MPGRVTFFVLKLLGHSAGPGLKYVPSLPLADYIHILVCIWTVLGKLHFWTEKLLGVTPHSLNDYQTIILSEVSARSLPFILPQ